MNKVEESVRVHVYPNADRTLRIVGYKSLSELIKGIKMVDKNCKMYGTTMKLEITFPFEKNSEILETSLSYK